MSQKKNEGILCPTEIRVVGSYTDRLLSFIIRPLSNDAIVFNRTQEPFTFTSKLHYNLQYNYSATFCQVWQDPTVLYFSRRF